MGVGGLALLCPVAASGALVWAAVSRWVCELAPCDDRGNGEEIIRPGLSGATA